MLYSVDIEVALSNWRSLHRQWAFNDFRAVKSDTPELLRSELSGFGEYFSVPFISIERARFTELGAGARCEGRLFGGSNPVAQQPSGSATERLRRGTAAARLRRIARAGWVDAH
jgi:hypothetical protein